MSDKKAQVKPNKTICIDHDITEIVDKINDQGGKLSPVVCNLLRFYRDNDYRIPVAEVEYIDNREDESYTPPDPEENPAI